MAEPEVNEPEVNTPSLTKEDIAKLVSDGVKNTITELSTANNASNSFQANLTPSEPKDPWDDILDPRINKKTAQSNLLAEAAGDKVDFYSSDAWLVDMDDLLPGESPEEIRQAKSQVRDIIEKTFTNLLKTNRGMPRADIVDYALGQYIKSNKTTYTESLGKRSNSRKEQELNKARKGVDISGGNISNFTPADIHKMPTDKMLEEFGAVQF